ncbi:hypothetical protein [Succinatimonas hippei]
MGGAVICKFISIIIPIHRVIGFSGTLNGYSNEILRKQNF